MRYKTGKVSCVSIMTAELILFTELRIPFRTDLQSVSKGFRLKTFGLTRHDCTWIIYVQQYN